MISYNKESTNSSFLFVKIQKYGAKAKGNIATSTSPAFYTECKAVEISAKIMYESFYKVR